MSKWDKLLSRKQLLKGWHLTRSDIRADFVEDIISPHSFANDVHKNLDEVSRQINNNEYYVNPLINIDIPKGELGLRPGSVMAIKDRVVLFTCLLQLVKKIDECLPSKENAKVYSYRLKDGGLSERILFNEQDFLQHPYLKKKTINTHIDPFEPWYANWPVFEQDSINLVGRYQYMVITDIAAYFENIHLRILRDQLLEIDQDNHKLVNFMISMFESWAHESLTGLKILRGLPQGNSISSCLGNFYLHEVDEYFARDEWEEQGLIYKRYVDDIRFFANSRSVVVKAMHALNKQLRKLHLNVQTSKTDLFQGDEIKNKLVYDKQIKFEKRFIDLCKKKSRGLLSDETNKTPYLKWLEDIELNFKGKRNKLNSNQLRLFRRWITAHSLLDSNKFCKRLGEEIEKSNDSRLIRRAVKVMYQFPQKHQFSKQLFAYLNNSSSSYPYNQAEVVRALRYASHFPDGLVDNCKAILKDSNKHFYLRVQCAHLISRTLLSKEELKDYYGVFKEANNISLKVSLAHLFSQATLEVNKKIIRELAFDPNPQIKEVGKLFSHTKNEYKRSTKLIRFVLNIGSSMRVCDYTYVLFLASESKDKRIKLYLLKHLKPIKNSHPCVNLRGLLSHVYDKIQASLVI